MEERVSNARTILQLPAYCQAFLYQQTSLDPVTLMESDSPQDTERPGHASFVAQFSGDHQAFIECGARHGSITGKDGCASQVDERIGPTPFVTSGSEERKAL